ncbi:hypothetical protein [Aquimarina rubra]|uniref:Uncharacterized protein n=1 Tax=Aquimarina rubra TaxID=1920033 RepID=A0ABW5LJX5_9FLAO
MKNLLLCLIFISSSIAIKAQEVVINSNISDQKESVSKKTNSLSKSPIKYIDTDSNHICYGETSKVAFYEVLIAKNGFNIELKDSKALVIRNTEEIISKKREEILYSEED